MLDAIALYLRYQSSYVILLRIVTTNLDLLSCASRKGKTDSDLIRNAVLLWNNVVFCAIFRCKRVQFRFLHQYAVFCAVLKSIDDLFFSCEFALWFINQITVWIDDSFFCVDELSFRRRFWPAWARKISNFEFWLAMQSSVKLLSRMRTCFDRTIVLYNLLINWYIICFDRSLSRRDLMQFCYVIKKLTVICMCIAGETSATHA